MYLSGRLDLTPSASGLLTKNAVFQNTGVWACHNPANCEEPSHDERVDS